MVAPTHRWILFDPATDEEWEFPRNPNAMTSPHPPRNSTIFSRASGYSGTSDNMAGVSRVIQFRQQPYEWSFSGDIRSEAQHDTFVEWTRKTGRLHVTDHLDRTFEIRIDSVDLTEERQSAKNAWKFNYTVKAIIYGQVS